SSKPRSGDNFKSTCAAAGKHASCCVIPVAGQAVLCQPAMGGGGNGGNNGGNGGGSHEVCPSGLYSVPQCCATGLLGVLDLDCQSPSRTSFSSSDFKSTCRSEGRKARCCVLPVAGQDVLCTNPL
ncbi:hypothetical protein E4U10_005883, partial [Claviceps purpurea]